MKKLILIISSVVLLFSGCTQQQPAPVATPEKFFCWQITFVNPYSYMYHNRCEKSEIITGDIPGTKVVYEGDLKDKRQAYKDLLEDSRRLLRLKEKKELF